MNLEVINIGSELLDGTRVNTNLTCLAERLKRLDIEITRAIIVGDDEEEILDVLSGSFSRAKMIITTGGLGPTLDDATKKAITRFFNRRLIIDNNVLRNVEEYYKKRNVHPPKLVYNQALVPRGGVVLPNPKGTAPGLILEERNKTLVALPGVPEELNYLVDNEVIPYLKQKIKFSPKVSRTFKIYGLTEAELSERVKQILKRKNVKFSFLPRQIEVVLKIESSGEKAANSIQEVEGEIKKLLGDAIYGVEDESLEEVVGLLLSRERKKIAVVESCTGGLISHRLTNIPGSSKYFEGGFITYSNNSKVDMLEVDEQLLKEKGAVSEEVARAMAIGLKTKAKVHFGLAVTGIAGPGGATLEKPVGLTFIALAKPDKTIVQKFQFEGDRELIKLKATQAALNLIRLNLIKK